MMPDNREMQRRIDEAFAFVERVVKAPDRYPDEAVLFLLDPSEVASAVTKERLRLLRELSDREYPSIFDLARSLGRDVSRVRKDLIALERLDLVTFTKSGNRIRARPAATGIYIPLFAPRKPRSAGRVP
jgi:predicted transcriptional regulator